MQQELAVVQRVYDLVINFLVVYSFQIAGAIIILIAGFIAGGWVARALLRLQEKRKVDITLRQFIASAARLFVIALFAIIALAKLGISMTPLIAALGGLAVGISLAIQGPVSNYGAGLAIILTRMFRVGDTICVQGCAGVVTRIDLAATRLLSDDGEDIFIPNKHIVGEIHRNSYAWRLINGRVGIDPDADAAAATAAIAQVLRASVPQDDVPAPLIGIEGFADGAVVIGYRYRVPAARYFELMYAVNDTIHRELRAAGIALAKPWPGSRTEAPPGAS